MISAVSAVILWVVIEVKLDLEARWSEIFGTASFDWQTPKYSIDK
jgi:hypothetical protein